MKYSFKCTCGDVMVVDAENREEAVKKIQDMMGQDAINQHMSEKHQGQPVPSKEQSDQMVEQMVVEGDLSEKKEEEGGETPTA